MINKYLNKIRKNKSYNNDYTKEIYIYDFFGDGEGDYEEISDLTTKECLVEYIKECFKQIELANECLNNKGEKSWT